MKFRELSNKDRYRIIRMGVQNGIHSVSDIEHIFDEGGDLNSDEQKQLEWSKNWHTQRVNYMPWTDEQKAAYLRAIDSTYDGGGFTRDPYKVMGFTPKGNNININYKSANNTEYGDQAETSGLVHELAHKLSYNANKELNKLDNYVPTPEDAMLRNQKLNRLMHPLEIGGLENAKTFVDYNAKSDVVRKQEKQFKKDGVYNSKLVEDDGYGHNAIESKARIDELRYIMNLDPRLIDINAGNVKVWRKRGKIPPSLKDYSDEQIAKMLNTFAYNGNSNVANYASNGGKLTKYSELNDKDRWAAIRAGVRAGYNSIDDIERAYNEYAEGGDINDQILKGREPKAEFYQRLLDPNRNTIKDWESDNVATHKMSYVTEGDKAVVYPEVQNINGKLVDFTRPPYNKWAGYESAIQRGDTIQMTPKEAEYWTKNYKNFYPNFAKGGCLNKNI